MVGTATGNLLEHRKSADVAVAKAVTIPSSSESSPATHRSFNTKSSKSPPYNSTAATILQHQRRAYGSGDANDDSDSNIPLVVQSGPRRDIDARALLPRTRNRLRLIGQWGMSSVW